MSQSNSLRVDVIVSSGVPHDLGGYGGHCNSTLATVASGLVYGDLFLLTRSHRAVDALHSPGNIPDISFQSRNML